MTITECPRCGGDKCFTRYDPVHDTWRVECGMCGHVSDSRGKEDEAIDRHNKREYDNKCEVCGATGNDVSFGPEPRVGERLGDDSEPHWKCDACRWRGYDPR